MTSSTASVSLRVPSSLPRCLKSLRVPIYQIHSTALPNFARNPDQVRNSSPEDSFETHYAPVPGDRTIDFEQALLACPTWPETELAAICLEKIRVRRVARKSWHNSVVDEILTTRGWNSNVSGPGSAPSFSRTACDVFWQHPEQPRSAILAKLCGT
jgi:hypothetical protein